MLSCEIAGWGGWEEDSPDGWVQAETLVPRRVVAAPLDSLVTTFVAFLPLSMRLHVSQRLCAMRDVTHAGERREHPGRDHKEVYFGVACGMDAAD